MFKNNLSSAVLTQLSKNDMSQGGLAKKIGMSSRQINNILNKHSNATITSLEKLCVAFNVTPNDLLIPQNANAGAEAREINQLLHNPKNGTNEYMPLCPHCGKPIEAEYSAYCDTCFGKLSWEKYIEAEIIEAEK